MGLMKRFLSAAASFAAALTAAGCGGRSGSDVLTVTFIDVGKGDCIVAECGGSTLMIDTGYAETAGDVLGQLSEMGINQLDTLIITHYDKDHAGGAAEIAEKLPVSQLWLPGYEGGSLYGTVTGAAEKLSINTAKVTSDVTFQLGTAQITVYASDIGYEPSSKKQEGNDNDVSLVVSAVHGQDSILFAGDIESAGIKSFVKKNTRGYGIIKMPHHGRKDKNTDRLIESTMPEISVITDSADQPADGKTLSLLKDTDIYRLSECGDIVIDCDGSGDYKVKTAKRLPA